MPTFLRILAGGLLKAALLSAATMSPALAWTAHSSDAESLVDDLSVSRDNVYGSDPSYIEWRGTRSSARTVCGTFITQLLSHTYGLTPSTFTQWMGSTSPDAETYHSAIMAENHFTRITNIEDVQPGDLIAIKHEGGSVSGHMMVVASSPRPESASSPVVPNTTQYSLSVIDSSSSHHGDSDTRVTHPSSSGNGIGRGRIRIYVNDSLRPVGYTWSTSAASDYYGVGSRPLAIGRIHRSYLEDSALR